MTFSVIARAGRQRSGRTIGGGKVLECPGGAAAAAGWEGLSRRGLALLAEKVWRARKASNNRAVVTMGRFPGGGNGAAVGSRAWNGWSSGALARHALSRACAESTTGGIR